MQTSRHVTFESTLDLKPSIPLPPPSAPPHAERSGRRWPMGSSFILGIALDLSRTRSPYFCILAPSKIARPARWARCEIRSASPIEPRAFRRRRREVQRKKIASFPYVADIFPHVFLKHLIEETILIYKPRASDNSAGFYILERGRNIAILPYRIYIFTYFR